MSKRLIAATAACAALIAASSAFAETPILKRSSTTIPKIVRKAPNAPCVQKAVGIREDAIIAANDVLAASVKSSLTARKTALVEAWGLADAKARKAARNAAWETYRKAQKAAKAKHSETIKAAWTKWAADAKVCKAEANMEPSGLDIKVAESAAVSAGQQ